MADIIQYDIFGNPIKIDPTKDKRVIQQRNRERAAKAAETRRKKRQEFEQLWWKMYYIARETEGGNLFGETHSEQERKDAEAFIQKYEVNGKLRKPKTNEAEYRRLHRIVESAVREAIF